MTVAAESRGRGRSRGVCRSARANGGGGGGRGAHGCRGGGGGGAARGMQRQPGLGGACRAELRRGGAGDRGDSAPERPDLRQSSDGGRGAGVPSGDPEEEGAALRPEGAEARAPASPLTAARTLKITQARGGPGGAAAGPEREPGGVSIQGSEEPSRPRGAEEAEEAEQELPAAGRPTSGLTPSPRRAPGAPPLCRRRGLAGWPEAGGRSAQGGEAAAAAAALGREEAAEGAERGPGPGRGGRWRPTWITASARR